VRFTRSLAESDLGWKGKLIFIYGLTHKLARFMDAGAPRVYRDMEREKLLAICNEHGGAIRVGDSPYHSAGKSESLIRFLLQTRYQLLWDRIIKNLAEDGVYESFSHSRKEPAEIYQHYGILSSLSHRYLVYSANSDNTGLPSSEPKVSYYKFLTMLREGTLVIVNGPTTTNKIKKMIDDLPTFSSFLEDDQKDGDVAFEQDGLDSSEEEEQDGSG